MYVCWFARPETFRIGENWEIYFVRRLSPRRRLLKDLMAKQNYNEKAFLIYLSSKGVVTHELKQHIQHELSEKLGCNPD